MKNRIKRASNVCCKVLKDMVKWLVFICAKFRIWYNECLFLVRTMRRIYTILETIYFKINSKNISKVNNAYYVPLYLSLRENYLGIIHIWDGQ